MQDEEPEHDRCAARDARGAMDERDSTSQERAVQERGTVT